MADNDKKICPMRLAQYCNEEKCAWWLSFHKRCAVKGLAEKIVNSNLEK